MADELRRDFGESEEEEILEERVINIDRVAKVVKGGRHFGFRALVVVGNGKGSVGVGLGKAREVPAAINKGVDRAKKNMKQIPLAGTTIPHRIVSKFGAAKVLLKPASPGTGLIAGGSVRAVLEAAGVKDILTKSMGSANILNVVKATMIALQTLQDPAVVAERRGVPLSKVSPFWMRGEAHD